MSFSDTPIIIGVADIKNRTSTPKEPAVLIHEAILAALEDASASQHSQLQSSIDSISVVKTWTWPYPDLPGLLASKLGVEPKHKFYSEHGGDKPGKLLDEAAKRVARGESNVAIVSGGEALASCKCGLLHSIIMLNVCRDSTRCADVRSVCICGSREITTTRLDKALTISRVCLHANRHGSRFK